MKELGSTFWWKVQQVRQVKVSNPRLIWQVKHSDEDCIFQLHFCSDTFISPPIWIFCDVCRPMLAFLGLKSKSWSDEMVSLNCILMQNVEIHVINTSQIETVVKRLTVKYKFSYEQKPFRVTVKLIATGAVSNSENLLKLWENPFNYLLLGSINRLCKPFWRGPLSLY